MEKIVHIYKNFNRKKNRNASLPIGVVFEGIITPSSLFSCNICLQVFNFKLYERL